MARPSSKIQMGGPPRVGTLEAAYIPPKRPSLLRAILRKLSGVVVVAAIVDLLLVFGGDCYVRLLAKGRAHDKLEEIQPGRPALVLGTSPYMTDGKENTYFHGRMQAAANLYHAGRVTFLIVSGDNRTMRYNEPLAMRKALEALGVPRDKIRPDYAGLRTLDSIVRVKEVFGQKQVVVVSQRFHLERAIFLARHFDVEAEGFVAEGDGTGAAYWRNWVRERLARVKMLLDLYVFDTGPRHLGPKEPVPEGPSDPVRP